MATPSSTPGKRRTKISARLMNEESKNNRHWRSEFIATLAETSNVTAAAQAAGIHPSRAYKVKRLEPEFAREWLGALIEGYDNLEMEVLHRLRFGEPKDAERKFDNATAMRLLAQHRDTVVRERAMREHEDVEAVRASIDRKIAQIKAQVMARRAADAAAQQGAADGG